MATSFHPDGSYHLSVHQRSPVSLNDSNTGSLRAQSEHLLLTKSRVILPVFQEKSVHYNNLTNV